MKVSILVVVLYRSYTIWEKGMATHSSILAWRIPWTGAWQAAVHGVERSLSLYRKHYKFRNHEVEIHVSSYLVQFPDTIKQ